MQYAKPGQSNLTVSKICLGTMHFGGTTPEEEAYRIMDKALEMGINWRNWTRFSTSTVDAPSNRGKRLKPLPGKIWPVT